MKNVLLPVHDDAGQEARLQAALDLTRTLGGHLTCLAVVEAPTLAADAMSGDAYAILSEAAQAQEAPNAGRLRDRLPVEDVAWDWQEAMGDVAESLVAAAGMADVIVASPKIRCFPGHAQRELAADILTRCRAPVLVVPEGHGGFHADGRALVAWNGSDQAAAALRAATPLLGLASRTMILEIDDGTVKAPAEDAAAYLSRHGVKPVIRRERGHQAPVAAMLRDALRTGRFDYVVMGAYSRFRITEALLGGVSRDMLRTCPIPLFMAH
ncbi:universal stress protein [Sphingomonas oryzagri]|jgi:nucleotide-binding universal stress UspA family protein|uniref:Universal stress protein n=1 Tax=Sphingomonas oryzagri TaxID=3042314 RepID=A0ABT6N5Q4_9SPHN|nr:universal stress protein [Sphingomonas oryzagri]MDH7640426.1 universal stress protein [Sphingomonas oryzagri]